MTIIIELFFYVNYLLNRIVELLLSLGADTEYSNTSGKTR